jgi:hypothetical protein
VRTTRAETDPISYRIAWKSNGVVFLVPLPLRERVVALPRRTVGRPASRRAGEGKCHSFRVASPHPLAWLAALPQERGQKQPPPDGHPSTRFDLTRFYYTFVTAPLRVSHSMRTNRVDRVGQVERGEDSWTRSWSPRGYGCEHLPRLRQYWRRTVRHGGGVRRRERRHVTPYGCQNDQRQIGRATPYGCQNDRRESGRATTAGAGTRIPPIFFNAIRYQFSASRRRARSASSSSSLRRR